MLRLLQLFYIFIYLVQMIKYFDHGKARTENFKKLYILIPLNIKLAVITGESWDGS
jgi:hypothetical protein